MVLGICINTFAFDFPLLGPGSRLWAVSFFVPGAGMSEAHIACLGSSGLTKLHASAPPMAIHIVTDLRSAAGHQPGIAPGNIFASVTICRRVQSRMAPDPPIEMVRPAPSWCEPLLMCIGLAEPSLAQLQQAVAASPQIQSDVPYYC